MVRIPLFGLFRRPPAPPKPVREPYILDADGLSVQVRRKPIRTLRLSLRPPDGALRVSAPLRVSDKAIRAFVLSRREWITGQRRRLAEVEARPEPQYLDGEVLPLWDGAVTLWLRVRGKTATATLAEPGILELSLPEGATRGKRETAVKRWYGRELLKAAQALLPTRQAAMGVRAQTLRARSMRSRWGTCNARTGVITLALELARRPPEALDYVLTHELAHLITRGHGRRFQSVLDRHLPDWRARRKRLNTREEAAPPPIP